MAVFNNVRKEIDAKIVYYGPGLSGKTTNLQFIHQNLKPEQRGKLVSLATNEERTLFFDFLPIELERVRGFKTRFHLYTVPGQTYYGATRRAVLSGADGVIFVADSQADKMEDNLLSFKDLQENMCYYRKKIENTPLIIQYNKRDLPNILPVEELNKKINPLNVLNFEASAISGKGVFEALTMICRLVLKAIEEGTEKRDPARKPEMAHETPPSLAPALAKSVSSVESPGNGQGTFQGGAPHPGKKIFPVEAASRMSEETFAKEIKPPNGIFFPPETRLSEGPELSSASEIMIPPKEVEKKKINGRNSFVRMFGKIASELLLKESEEPQKMSATTPGAIRIISCAQPHILPPGKLKIPLTIEIEGVAKNLAVNLVINLENVQPKAD